VPDGSQLSGRLNGNQFRVPRCSQSAVPWGVLMNTKRSGFTLLEVVVIVGVSGFLMALVAPATLESREVARRKTCVKNLKQIALATHNYHESHRSFPSGWIRRPNTSKYVSAPFVKETVIPLGKSQTDGQVGVVFGPKPGQHQEWRLSFDWSWHAMLLPFMGVKGLKADFDELKTSPKNLGALMTEVDSYVCPSARLPAERPGMFGYSSYRCVMGTRSSNGMMYMNSSVRFADVKDGTSLTILVGESLMGLWGDGYSCCARIADDNNDNVPDRSTPPRGGRPSAFDTWWTTAGVHYFGFGSWHADVCHFAFVDGRVKPISKRVDFRVLKALATRAGGEAVKVP